MPLALEQRVTAELDRLQAEGIICPIKVSDWATPIEVAPTLPTYSTNELHCN